MTNMKIKRIERINTTQALYKTLEQAVSDTAKVLTVKARREAPEDTGFLKASIKHNISRLKAFVKAWAHYAPYVEYGTMYMRANPFMRRAIEDTKRIMPTIISRAFRRHFK